MIRTLALSTTLGLSLATAAEATVDPLDTLKHFISQHGQFVATDLAAEIRTSVHSDRFTVAVREGQNGSFELTFRLESVRRGDAVMTLAEPRPSASGPRATIDRGGLIEWLIQRSEGLEHGFDLSRRLEGEGPLRIELAIEGAQKISIRNPRSAILRGAGGVNGALHYDGLKVYDSRGDEVSARLVGHVSGLAIEIDDHQAPYPLRVDPILSPAEWSASGQQGGAQSGFALATVGDLNHDGYSEVAVGLPYYDGPLGADQGRVKIYRGSPTGIDGVVVADLFGPGAGSRFGWAISTAGDFDGDGHFDVVIGAPRHVNGSGGLGSARLYRGNGTSLDPTNWGTLESTTANSQYGYSVAGGGDLNRDGKSDLVIGEPYNGVGMAHVYLGRSIPPVGSGTLRAGDSLAGESHGLAVAMVGDVNADGYDDIAVGDPFYDLIDIFGPDTPDVGRVKLYFGEPTTVGIALNGPSLGPSWGDPGLSVDLNFGYSVAGAGDVDGDGADDLIVGVPSHDQSPKTNTGSVRVFLGRNIIADRWDIFDEISGQNSSDHFGARIDTAGDIDGDGLADIVIGAPDALTGSTRNGRAYAYCGRPQTVDSEGLAHVTLDFCGSMTGEDDGDRFGFGVATSGDVDGDGFSDLIVGAHVAESVTPIDEGRVYSYLGSPEGSFTTSLWDGSGGARAGTTIVAAGNLDGDGRDEVVVGAPDASGAGEARVYRGSGGYGLLHSPYPGSRFGESLASGCDVNGDGYNEVAVGGPSYDFLFSNQGRVWLWYGSEDGVFGDAASAPWTKGGTTADESFGRALACGDVTGDGRADLIVGARGRVDLFLGSTSQLSSSSAWSLSSAAPSFGGKVAFVGDVNNDGFGDILISETGYSGPGILRGRAMLYYGGPNGPSTTPGQTFVGEQNSAQFATAIAGAGDVNSDGYADIVIGAFGFDIVDRATIADAGKIYVYLGGPLGPSSAPSFTADGASSGRELGRSVASAGDIDADGYGDIVVGAPCQATCSASSVVRVYYGGQYSPTGSFSSIASGSNNQGSAVAATDQNGDGFSDIVYSSHLLRGTDGQVWIAHSNHAGAGDSLPFSRRARQLDRLGNPIADQAKERSPGHHEVAADGRAASKGPLLRLVLETKPVGQPFDGTNLRRGPWMPQSLGTIPSLSASYTDLDRDLFHWRARIVTNDPRFPGSPWLTLGARGGADLDFRSPQAIPPGKVVKLVFASGSTTQLSWQTVFEAEWYDLVRGALPALTNSGGNFATSTTTCVANDALSNSVTDPTTPSAGAGLWYLARAVNAIAAGSYDDSGSGLSAPRDAEIQASGVACP